MFEKTRKSLQQLDAMPSGLSILLSPVKYSVSNAAVIVKLITECLALVAPVTNRLCGMLLVSQSRAEHTRILNKINKCRWSDMISL